MNAADTGRMGMTSESGFYFHVVTPVSMERGIDVIRYPSFEAAYLDALAAIPSMSAELLCRGIDPMECSFLLCDENDRLLETIHFREIIKSANKVPDHPRNTLLPVHGSDTREYYREVRAELYLTRQETRRLVEESKALELKISR